MGYAVRIRHTNNKTERARTESVRALSGGKMSVTICVRVQSLLGPNKPLPMPPVMPFFSAHFTAS